LLGKIAIESVYGQAPYPGLNLNPYSSEYDSLRKYVRFWPGTPRFIWFAYQSVQGCEGVPRILAIPKGNGAFHGALCEIRLPGMSYVFPLPPIIEPDLLRTTLQNWTIVESAAMHSPADLTASIRLRSRTSTEPRQ
jgi:hypothetical protein